MQNGTSSAATAAASLQHLLHVLRQAKRLRQAGPVEAVEARHGEQQQRERLALVAQHAAPVLQHLFRLEGVFGARRLDEQHHEEVGHYGEADARPCAETS